MKPFELIDAAREFARAAHADQTDDDGTNHFEHCQAVAEIVELVDSTDYKLQAAAYLHDVIEDARVDPEILADRFGEDVAALVVEVTKVDGEFPNLHTRRAVMLKFADRLHNLSRMEPWDYKRQAGYMRKSRFW
jgi:(p)ppGpp synthase/HD superfamily hydrolase